MIATGEFDKVIQDWATRFVRERKANLIRQKLKASGKLESSIEESVNRFSAGLVASIIFSHSFYGRYYDLKTVKRAEANPKMAAAIQEWVKELGVEKFSRYKDYKKLPQDPVKKIEAIGWAVAKGMHKKSFKSRPWFLSGKTRDVNKLQKQIVDVLGPAVLNDLRLTVQSGF